MPEAVQNFTETKDFREADRIQRNLLLDKENHKFQYKEIEHGARAQKYYSSIEWLLRADIIHLSKKVALIMGLQR